MILEGDGDVYYATDLQATFATSRDRVASPTRPVRMNDIYSGEYIPWGDDNLHPQNTIKTIESNDILPDVIDFKVRALTSGGLQYGDHYTNEQGQDIFVPLRISEIDDFLEMIEVDNYLDESTRDYYTHANYFPEIILNVGRKVVGLYCNDAAFTRLGLQQKTGKNRGKILEAFVGADWTETLAAATAERITAVDPYYKVVQQLQQLKGYKFIIPSRAQSNGRLDYQKGSVDFLIASGWLDIDKNIPLWKKRVMSERLGIRYHIEVNKSYWTERYKDWETKSAAEKSSLRTKAYQTFINFFKAQKDAGNVLFTDYGVVHGNKEYSDWKITVIDDKKAMDGMHIEDSTQSTAHIIMSQGVDHTMRGLMPGKGFSAGSGSDKRVAFNQHVLLSQPHQRRILRPFDYIADLNNWHRHNKTSDRRLKFWFKNTFIATLDHGKDTKPANDQNTKKT